MGDASNMSGWMCGVYGSEMIRRRFGYSLAKQVAAGTLEAGFHPNDELGKLYLYRGVL